MGVQISFPIMGVQISFSKLGNCGANKRLHDLLLINISKRVYETLNPFVSSHLSKRPFSYKFSTPITNNCFMYCQNEAIFSIHIDV